MITPEPAQTIPSSLDALPTEQFLLVVGQRVRKQRSQKSMSRKRLAEVSGVSERYLAQLESGQGNMSIALLRKVTKAIGMSLGALMAEDVNDVHVEACPTGDDSRAKTSTISSESATQPASHLAGHLVAEV